MNSKRQHVISTLNRLFKTDIAYLIHGVGWLGGGKILSSVFSFVLVIAFANLMPAETYGTYSYVMAVISIVVLTSLPGINSSLARSLAKGFDGSFFTAQRVRIRWGTIGALILLTIGGYYFYQENTILGNSFLVAGLLFVPFVSFSLFTSYLNSKKLFRELAQHNVIIKFLFALSLSLTLLVTNNVALVIAVNMGIIAVTGVVFTKKIVKKYEIISNNSLDPNLISYGKHLTIMSIFETAAKYLDKILLWHFFGPAQVAVWTFAYTPIQMAQGLVKKTLGPVAFPKFAQNDFSKTKEHLPAKVGKLFIVLVPITLIYVLIAPQLFKYALPQYEDSVIYSKALIVLLLFIPLNFYSGFLLAHARKVDLYFIKIGFGLTSMIAMIVFIPTLGLWGAVIAQVIAWSVRGLLSYWFFVKAKN